MSPKWEIAGGSVRGTRHRAAERNNQDALCWVADDDVLVLVVTDGCSAGASSEAGALFGSRIAARRAARVARQAPDLDGHSLARAIRDAVVAELSSAHLLLGASDEVLHDYLLFTAVVAVITPERTTIFVMGDGVAALNGVVRVVESERNCPAYPAYMLRDGALISDPVLLWRCPTCDVQSLLIGTDGVTDLVAQDSLSRFWTDDRFYTNPDQLRRWLTLANRETRRVEWSERRIERSAGILPDDTTLLVARRRVAQ